MPEGDTVWNTARQLHRALVGRQLTASDFRVPRLATEDLAGWTVLDSASRGKHLLLRLGAPGAGHIDGARPEDQPGDQPQAQPGDQPQAQPGDQPQAQPGDQPQAQAGDQPAQRTLLSHLRMDGAWRLYAPGERWAGRPSHLIRVVLRTAGAVAVGYHLHDLALVPTDAEDTLVGHLGPDLLGPDWDEAEAVRRLLADPDRPIAEALLDQRNLAGIGNFYKAEVLFLRGVWPWTPVRRTPDLAGLVALAQRLLAANRGRWTQSTTGSLRRGETSHVYGRRGQPCRRCATPIRVTDQGIGERITYWCSTCQPNLS